MTTKTKTLTVEELLGGGRDVEEQWLGAGRDEWEERTKRRAKKQSVIGWRQNLRLSAVTSSMRYVQVFEESLSMSCRPFPPIPWLETIGGFQTRMLLLPRTETAELSEKEGAALASLAQWGRRSYQHRDWYAMAWHVLSSVHRVVKEFNHTVDGKVEPEHPYGIHELAYFECAVGSSMWRDSWVTTMVDAAAFALLMEDCESPSPEAVAKAIPKASAWLKKYHPEHLETLAEIEAHWAPTKRSRKKGK